MTDTKQTEIPKEMREFAVQSIDQARAAYTQFLDAARKAQDMVKTMIPANPVAEGLSEVQERAMKFTQQNLDASFSLAQELAKAKDLAEALQIQNRHAQLQMHAFTLQAQELSGLVTAAASKTKWGR
jgi:phasin